MRFKEFKTLREYVDPEDAKRAILLQVNDIDPSDEEQIKLLDRVYTILHKNKVADRFLPIVEPKLREEYNEKAIRAITTKMVTSDRLNFEQKNKFLDNLQNNRCVNHKLFLSSGHYSIDDLFYNDPINQAMFLEFFTFGAGEKRAGKGEHALAIMSTEIKQKGTGDIDVSGKPVELKTAVAKGSGRLGEGGVSAETVMSVIKKYPELAQAFDQFKAQKGQKSINITDFTSLVNSIDYDQSKRAQIGKDIFENTRFGSAGGVITNAFAKPNADPKNVHHAYIAANFDWYKKNPDMGGAWEYLSSISLGSRAMVTATSGEDLVKLYTSGALGSSKPAIVPTQPTDTFFQVNPTAK